MKLSELLFERTRRLWDEAAGNPFVAAMADGTLTERQYKSYMLQDYYYLTEYIEILRQMRDRAERPETAEFLERVIAATVREKDTVHIPEMKKLGITDEEVQSGRQSPECSGYLQYLRKTAQEGTLRGLCALLQCSWSYAYIAETVTESCGDRLKSSAYAGWFSAYTSEEYAAANRSWTEHLDLEAQDIDDAEAERLCSIFEDCAHFENSFWNSFT